MKILPELWPLMDINALFENSCSRKVFSIEINYLNDSARL